MQQDVLLVLPWAVFVTGVLGIVIYLLRARP